MLVLAGRAVGPVASAQRDLAEGEVIAEVLPFAFAGFSVLLCRPFGAALVDELSALGGVQVQVAEKLRGDVNRIQILMSRTACLIRIVQSDGGMWCQGRQRLILRSVRCTTASPTGTTLSWRPHRIDEKS